MDDDIRVREHTAGDERIDDSAEALATLQRIDYQLDTLTTLMAAFLIANLERKGYSVEPYLKEANNLKDGMAH
mgnify:CR=1 FL=1